MTFAFVQTSLAVYFRFVLYIYVALNGQARTGAGVDFETRRLQLGRAGLQCL